MPVEDRLGLRLVNSNNGANNDALLKADSWDKRRKSTPGVEGHKLSGFSQALMGKLPCIIESTHSAQSDMENDSGIIMRLPTGEAKKKSDFALEGNFSAFAIQESTQKDLASSLTPDKNSQNLAQDSQENIKTPQQAEPSPTCKIIADKFTIFDGQKIPDVQILPDGHKGSKSCLIVVSYDLAEQMSNPYDTKLMLKSSQISPSINISTDESQSEKSQPVLQHQRRKTLLGPSNMESISETASYSGVSDEDLDAVSTMNLDKIRMKPFDTWASPTKMIHDDKYSDDGSNRNLRIKVNDDRRKTINFANDGPQPKLQYSESVNTPRKFEKFLGKSKFVGKFASPGKGENSEK